MSAQPLIEVDDVVAGFGATTVLHGLTFQVADGEVAGIFGLNGAGKSVSMKVLAGIVPVRSGSVRFDGTDITRLGAEERVAMGMAHVPQGRQVFAALTVEQNLRLGAYTLRRRDKSRYASVLDGVYDRFPILAGRKDQAAGTLSGGQQAALAVGRALMAEPRLILVDEPSAGLAPVIVQELFAILRDVARSGVTMVLVEQNVAFGLQLVDTARVMQVGRIVHSGPVAELDEVSLARYLGIGRLLGSGVSQSMKGRRAATREKAATRRSTPAKKKAPPRKGVAKKTAAKKTPAKKTPAKETPAKETATKKAATKKAPRPRKSH